MGTARQAGIPVPDVVGAGLLDEVPFLVLRYCEPAIDGMVGPWAWLSPNDPLLRDGGYPATQQPALRALLVDLQAEPFAFGLAHGDLAPRNLIGRGRTEAPVLLDWGTATTGPAPWTDLQRMYQWAVHDHSITPAALADFAAAAGTPMTAATERVLVRLTVLRYLDLARWARERRPELYADYLAACSAGIRTALRP